MKSLDLFLLGKANTVLFALQHWTGLSGEWWTKTLWSLYAVAALIESLSTNNRWIQFGISLAMTSYWGMVEDDAQKTANRSQMPTKCDDLSVFGGTLGKILRITAWLLLLADVVYVVRYLTRKQQAQIDCWTIIADVLYVLAAYASCSDRWPNNGPKLKDRWKNFSAGFAPRQTVSVKE